MSEKSAAPAESEILGGMDATLALGLCSGIALKTLSRPIILAGVPLRVDSFGVFQELADRVSRKVHCLNPVCRADT